MKKVQMKKKKTTKRIKKKEKNTRTYREIPAIE